MLFIAPCAQAVRVVKSRLAVAFPHIPSSHLTEALAAAAGFNTNAALRASFWEPGADPAAKRSLEFDDSKFLQRLRSLGHDDHWDWRGFSRFAETEWVGGLYNSPRSRCARNLMTAAVTSGLLQKVFGLGAGDNFWPGSEERHGHFFHVWMPADIPVVAWVNDVGMGELVIHVACWPKGDVIRYHGGFEAGEATAIGWLERADGKWIMNDHRGGIDLSVRRALHTRLSQAITPTLGFLDQGTFFS